jgi:hypothetical protein
MGDDRVRQKIEKLKNLKRLIKMFQSQKYLNMKKNEHSRIYKTLSRILVCV